MGEKKAQAIGLRVGESLKKTLNEIAKKETRSVSQQVEHFVKLGIEEYLKKNPEFDQKQKSSSDTQAQP
jgi:hypothetical protein